MQRTALIHVGTHKTGTTSVQNVLARHTDAYGAGGVLYPRAGRRWEGHHNVAWELANDPRFEEKFGTVDAVAAEFADAYRWAHTGILSSEDFGLLWEFPERLGRLTRKLSDLGYQPKAVLTFRQPSSYIVSLYIQLRQLGLDQTLDDFVSGVVDTGLARHGRRVYCIDAVDLVFRLGEVFGRANVFARPYDAEDNVSRFFEMCTAASGSEIASLTPRPKRLNVTSRRAAARIRLSPDQLNAIQARFPKPQYAQICTPPTHRA